MEPACRPVVPTSEPRLREAVGFCNFCTRQINTAYGILDFESGNPVLVKPQDKCKAGLGWTAEMTATLLQPVRW